MTITQFFDQVNGAFRGTDDDAPTTGVDFNLWLATANRKQNEWATDEKNVWKSLFRYEKPLEPGTVATNGTTTLTGTNTFFTDYNVGDTILVSGETVRTIASITSDTSLDVTIAFSTTASTLTYYHATIIQSGIQSYSLPRTFSHPSDRAIVSTLNSGILYYKIGKPQERERYENEVYISSALPQEATFYSTIDTTHNDNLLGGTLKVPGYYIPADFTTATDTVTIDDPYWLVYAVASELAFNDITYSDKAPDLNNKANSLYSKMITNNRRGTNNNPRQARTNVNRILDPAGESDFGSDGGYY